MSHEATIHRIQTHILRDLLFTPGAGYAELQKSTGIESDHFKFHIARLVELGYVAKSTGGKYTLSHAGKEYANKLDTDRNTIERQPKSAVIIVLQDEASNVLIQERLKHPYFGFFGYPGGKIRWGETILHAAARELKEETGLQATLCYQGVYHEHVTSAESGELLEDKIFHIIRGARPSGSLIRKFEGGRNAWMSLNDLAATPNKYASTEIETDVGLGKQRFVEKTQIYTKDEF